jgi:predicted nuclease with TOPRIM domain
LQETRITNMIRRLDGIRDQLSGMRQDLSTAEEMQTRVEGMLASTTLAENSEGRQQLMQELPERKRQAAALKARVSALTSEEGQLVADITAEQARWTDINARLDELEHLLAKK